MNNRQIYTIEPLFDFQALCDTDLGLYRLIKEDYYDRSVFDNDLFDSNDERFIKTILLSRRQFNPLNIFCKKNALTQSEIDDLYQEFLDKEYDRILQLSPYTTIMNIASISNNTNKIVNVIVLCASEKEKEWINKYNLKLKCIIADYKDFDLRKYDTIYIKDIYTLTLFKQESIKNKNIIFPRFMFNLETDSRKMDIPVLEVAKKYYKENKFLATDPYKDIWVPMSEMV